jgi:flagellin-like protein
MPCFHYIHIGLKRSIKRKMKISKSRKALSPVVASIILIAVTVAVSLAVAAWMGALTVGFMGSSSITITNTSFQGTSGAANNYINITMKNTGTKSVTISNARVNGVVKSFSGVTTLSPGDANKVLMISNVGWSTGNPYKIELSDSNGVTVGVAQQTA